MRMRALKAASEPTLEPTAHATNAARIDALRRKEGVDQGVGLFVIDTIDTLIDTLFYRGKTP